MIERNSHSNQTDIPENLLLVDTIYSWFVCSCCVLKKNSEMFDMLVKLSDPLRIRVNLILFRKNKLGSLDCGRDGLRYNY